MALQVLGWIAGEEDRLAGLMAQSGVSGDELRARAEDPVFLAAVMDYLLSDDQMVLGFAHEMGIRPEEPMQARAFLPGGDLPNWT